jgi:DNA-binding protein HU-beta
MAKKETAAAPTKKSAGAVLTTTEIGEHLASTFEIPKSHAKIYLTEAVALIGKHLKKGNKVRISGLGVFQVKKRAARKGRNPNTGAAIKIKASKRVGFAVARDLKAQL